MIVGSTITPNSLAMIDVVADAETPMISMAASARIVDPDEPEDEVGVQDAAERRADGGRDRRQHEGERREDDGLHRLRRRATATAGSPRCKRSAQTAGIKIVARGEVQPQRHRRSPARC